MDDLLKYSRQAEDLPTQMTAVGHPGPRSLHEADALVAVTVPVPQPGPRDLLVKVHATAVNPIDAKLRAGGKASPEAPRILGFEAAGEVVALGSAITDFKLGDRVFHPGQVNRPGTFAEYTLVDERIVGKLPDAVSFADAAALPMTALTAHELLFERMGIPEGAKNGSVLIINGAGGVGSIAIQLLRALTDMTVIATTSRPESANWCKKMGAHHVISHREPLSQGLGDLDIPAVNFVACLSHTADHLPEIIKCLKPFGTIGLIDQPKSLDIVQLREKALRIAFEGVFVKALMQKPDMGTQRQVLTKLAKLLAKGALQTTRNHTLVGLTVETARQAHLAMQAGSTVGKIVLVPHTEDARGD